MYVYLTHTPLSPEQAKHQHARHINPSTGTSWGGQGGGEEEQSKDPPFPWPQVINNYMHMAGFAYKIDDNTIYAEQ